MARGPRFIINFELVCIIKIHPKNRKIYPCQIFWLCFHIDKIIREKHFTFFFIYFRPAANASNVFNLSAQIPICRERFVILIPAKSQTFSNNFFYFHLLFILRLLDCLVQSNKIRCPAVNLLAVLISREV